MKETIKKFLIRLAYRLKCHPECDLEVPCHCNICGKPNNRFHYDRYHRKYDEFDGKSYNDYKDALIYSLQSYRKPDVGEAIHKTKESGRLACKLEVVPSGRIDYCGACKKYHGYNCPLD